jgi:hypothetical protein
MNRIARAKITIVHYAINGFLATVSIQKGGPEGLPFLDTLNKVKQDGSIDVSVQVRTALKVALDRLKNYRNYMRRAID